MFEYGTPFVSSFRYTSKAWKVLTAAWVSLELGERKRTIIY